MVNTNRPRQTKQHEPSQPILIAGGGIGGLTTAIALAQHGIATHILERHNEFSEAGAGIQLGPNGTRLLQKLDIADRLEPFAGVPDGINVFNGTNGKCLTKLPLGDWIAKRHGSPYWVLHRRDLQAALLDVALASDKIEITTGFTVAKVTQNDNGVDVYSGEGAAHRGRALIGADGIWSQIRRKVFHAPPLRPSGNIAARAVVSATNFAKPFAGNMTGLWLSKDSHVVHYPVHGSRDIAVILILATQVDALQSGRFNSQWNTASEPAALFAKLGPTAPKLLDFLQDIDQWRSWTLYDPPPLPQWSKGVVTLLGDAAHPVLPFLAQGAVMALEDAYVLASMVAQNSDDLGAAFSCYSALRQPRTTRVQERSRRNGRIYHMDHPIRWARDATLRHADARRLMRHYDWLYGWRADHAVETQTGRTVSAAARGH